MHTHFSMYIPYIFHLFHSFTAPKVHVTSWLSAAEYAAAWRHLSFMEAGVDEKLRTFKKNGNFTPAWDTAGITPVYLWYHQRRKFNAQEMIGASEEIPKMEPTDNGEGEHPWTPIVLGWKQGCGLIDRKGSPPRNSRGSSMRFFNGGHPRVDLLTWGGGPRPHEICFHSLRCNLPISNAF